jgi:N-acetylneuraminic acid mutarotase
VARWVVTGRINTPRFRHTATALPNGNVLMVGGQGYGATGLSSAELYDEATGTWRLTGAMYTGRIGHTATLLPNGKMLVVGGNSASGVALATAEVYDPTTGTWSPTSSLAAAREGHTAALLPNGKVLVVGGYDRDLESLPSAELYNPAAGTWSPAGNLSLGRSGHTATLLANGKVLVAGGIGASYDPNIQFPPPNKAELYDPDSNAWRVVGTDLRVDRHTATLLSNGKVLIAGGSGVFPCAPPPGCAAGTGRSAQLYDPVTETWSYTGSLNVGRDGHSASLLADGRVLVAGTGATGEAASAEVYDPGTGLWAMTGNLNFGRYYHTANLLTSGNVLVAGGLGANAPDTAELYAFVPSPPVLIGPGFSGVWYDPTQSGHGLVLEVLSGNRLLAAWFTFNPAGTEQAWFIGVGTYSGDTASIAAVDMPSGGRWITNPAPVVHNAWGTLSLKFTDCDHGKVDFSSILGYGSGSMNLTRLTLPAGLICP